MATEDDFQVIASPPFNVNVDNIKPSTKGIDVSRLLSAQMPATPRKSEFETNTEYGERVRKASASSLPHGIGPDSVLAVIQPASQFPPLWRGGNDTIETSYSPETEAMTVKLDNWLSCLPLKREVKPTGRYVAENGFGKKVTVTKLIEREICIGIDEGSKTKIDDLSFIFQVPRTDARRVKSNLAILLLGQPSTPFFAEESSHKNPDMSDPVEVDSIRKSIQLRIDDVWIIDSSTGAVLAKHHRSFLNSDPKLAQPPSSLGGCSYPQYHKSEMPNFDLVVEMKFLIRSDGSIESGSIAKSTGVPDLDQRALKTFSKCAFKPGMQNGVPVSGNALVRFHFSDYYAGNY